MKCKSCIHGDVCKHKGNYEQLHEKVKALEPQEPMALFSVSMECKKYQQVAATPRTLYDYQRTWGGSGNLPFPPVERI